MAKVLIMEDEPSITFILREILSDSGYDVTTVRDGRTGLKKLEDEPPPDIVIVDNKLPFYSGKFILERMNSSQRLKAIPKILISGSTPSLGDFPEQESYQAFISKPFDTHDLVKTVNSFLAEKLPC